jgi:hypothetical protein
MTKKSLTKKSRRLALNGACFSFKNCASALLFSLKLSIEKKHVAGHNNIATL